MLPERTGRGVVDEETNLPAGIVVTYVNEAGT